MDIPLQALGKATAELDRFTITPITILPKNYNCNCNCVSFFRFFCQSITVARAHTTAYNSRLATIASALYNITLGFSASCLLPE